MAGRVPQILGEAPGDLSSSWTSPVARPQEGKEAALQRDGQARNSL